MNSQPWHFTAVTDEKINQKLANAMGSMRPPAMKDGEAGMAPAIPEGMGEGEIFLESKPGIGTKFKIIL